jgi:ApbE superfamily uncharacterized protein (UPF0280 family)
MYTKRFYRTWVRRRDLFRFQITLGQSDLLILCERNLRRRAQLALARTRASLDAYLERDPLFAASLVPLRPFPEAPPLVTRMAAAAGRWEVGPMAAVAGAVAQAVGGELLEEAETVIIENGGDIYARSHDPLHVRIYAGADSPFSDRLLFRVAAREGVGVCTSSGRVGPSLSFGRADAVVAVAPDAACADAAATAIGNGIRCPGDVDRVMPWAARQKDLIGLVVCCGERLGIWGELELITDDGHPMKGNA